MAFVWRAAGINYVNFSGIAARVLRKSLKSQLQADARKRDVSIVKILYWADGKALSPGELPQQKDK